MLDFTLPMRPRKLRLAVEMTFSPALGIPGLLPQHGPQLGGSTYAPLLTNRSTKPARIASR